MRMRLDMVTFRKASFLLLTAGIFVLVAGYNLYWDGSKYHTSYYLLFLLSGMIYVVTDLRTLLQVAKEPLAITAAIFLFAVAVSQLYPGVVARPASDWEKLLVIMLSLLIIGQYVSSNGVLFANVLMAAVVSVSLVAIHHLYMYYIVEGHTASMRLVGYFIPENPLYLAQSFGFFSIIAVFFAVENRHKPVALLLMGGAGFVLVLSVMATQSRSYVVASLLAIILLLRGNKGKTVVGVVATVLVVFAVVLFLNPSILERTEILRPQIWKRALDIISERPFLGWGGEFYPQIQITGKSMVLTDPHNIFLTVWLKYGAISFLMLATLLCLAIVLIFRNLDNPLLRLGGTLLIYGVTMLSFEGHNIISKVNSTWHMIWIPLGIIIGAMHAKNHNALSKGPDV
jgi:O-antigen ligase